MKPIQKKKTKRSIATVCIWTIRHHDYLVAQIRIYMWSASATVLFLSLAGLIRLETALFSLLFGALSIAILLWTLNEIRRHLLLHIRDPQLKKEAYEAMLAFIQARRHKIKDRSGMFDHKSRAG